MKKKVSKKTPAQIKIAEVMHEFKEGDLHSGKGGVIVTDRKQAIAIALSEANELEEALAIRSLK
jgi:ribosomal protein L21E